MSDVEIQKEAKGQTEKAPAEEKSIVEIAKELRDEIREEREKLTAERQRIEEATARQMLGGRAEAGQHKLTAEEEQQARIQKEADEITNAFKK